MPRSGTARIPRSFVIQDSDDADFGPGVGQIEKGECAVRISFILKTSMRVKTEFNVPPEGFELLECQKAAHRGY